MSSFDDAYRRTLRDPRIAPTNETGNDSAFGAGQG